MKEHILAALEEQFQHWEKVLASLDEEQPTTPHFEDNWSIKDVVAHLWAWQQISIARMEAAIRDSEPQMPMWTEGLHGDWEEDANQVNARIYAICHQQPWQEVYQNWREGFLRLIAAGKPVSEKDLLDAGRYPWLKGFPVAFVLIASYEHHQEHIEELFIWLQEH